MAKPKQARLDSFFSPRSQDVQPSSTSSRPMSTEETPNTPVRTDTSDHGQQQTYEIGITNDLGQGGPRLTVSRARLFFAHNSRATHS